MGRELAGVGTSALLGAVRIYQATYGEEPPVSALADAVRLALPQARQRPGWSEQRHEHQDFVLWETGADGDHRSERRFAVVAPSDQDKELSAWTWSDGGVHMPPLARFLMHAAKLRYEVRVWNGGGQTGKLEREAEERIDRLQRLAREKPASADLLAELRRLHADMVGLTTAGTHLRKMRHTVEISLDNMTRALTDPLPDDLRLAEWFLQELDDTAHYLDLTLSNAEDVQRITRSMPPQDDTVPPAAGPDAPSCSRPGARAPRHRSAAGPHGLRRGHRRVQQPYLTREERSPGSAPGPVRASDGRS